MKRAILAVAALVGMHGAGLAQDAAPGEAAFRRNCRACHAIGENAKNLVGPALNGLDGRKSGEAAGYNYSTANKESGVVWGEASFLEYIRDPRAKMPGTKMSFAGLKDETQARALWGYLAGFGADGKPK